MSRRKGADKRVVNPDPRYNNVLVSKFTNGLMQRGKKSLARRIFYDAMDLIDQRVPDEEPMVVFEQAMENVRPRVEVKSRRVGGATYQVPMEVAQDRQFSLAMRWLVKLADGRKGVPMKNALASEIMDAYQGQGGAIRKRDEVHRMAQANKALEALAGIDIDMIAPSHGLI